MKRVLIETVYMSVTWWDRDNWSWGHTPFWMGPGLGTLHFFDFGPLEISVYC